MKFGQIFQQSFRSATSASRKATDVALIIPAFETIRLSLFPPASRLQSLVDKKMEYAFGKVYRNDRVIESEGLNEIRIYSNVFLFPGNINSFGSD